MTISFMLIEPKFESFFLHRYEKRFCYKYAYKCFSVVWLFKEPLLRIKRRFSAKDQKKFVFQPQNGGF